MDEIDPLVLPHFDVLTDEEKALLIKNSNLVKYNVKDVIFKQNTRTSHIMFVRTGLVKLYKEGRSNKTIILRLSLPGDYIGLLSVFGSELHEYSAAAIEPTDIYFIDITVFRNLINQNGKFAMRLLKLVSSDGLFILEKLMSQAHKQLPGRIANVLLYFSEEIYKDLTFKFPLTRRELAELAGTTKESFIRTLTEFKNDKIIELTDSKVEIKSLKIVKTLNELG
jgi:CRP/FNR family transcriptional regulator, polysaccharide utilization system transcription regulator